ncbi:Zn-ribbon domain-containing OB-fold protein [Acidovorax cavernicola]|uniref:Zn-ribbon domain-containing OB-fold protein n=1 Tax=Acidovorax cavernicola TaxID=1675792 RepID=A0A9X8D4S4_9BURK|nr:Zn-ribbon domain-containing OB-fold protein [Acidovorax cavernicola]RIX79601.1 Zn-ribbon domain-containing OB-fold protein [Acidovorax cavernicola]
MYPAELENAPPMVLHQPVLYADINYDVGRTNGRFFAALRDHRKITGTRCTACERTYLPPRMSCHECFAELTEWVDLADTGTLTAFTVVRETGMLQQMPVPYVVGLIQLDGADTALVHYIGEVDLDAVKAGMRVRAVLAPERTGHIGDIRYFTPVA